jgi:hypothetical protein
MQDLKRNLETLKKNTYPGRGIIIGLDESKKNMVQVYWIMGRSANSRNRVFESDETGRLWTEAADASKVEDPSLIIYNAMIETSGWYIVTNGDQTDTIAASIDSGGDFRSALMTRMYEPDAPNFTPRISGVSSFLAGKPRVELAVLKKSPLGDGCDRHFFLLEQFGAGVGHCITTYEGDGSPLPPFEGEPVLLPLKGNLEALADGIWQVLNPDNRVSLAVKFIDIESGQSAVKVINQYTKAQ